MFFDVWSCLLWFLIRGFVIFYVKVYVFLEVVRFYFLLYLIFVFFVYIIVDNSFYELICIQDFEKERNCSLIGEKVVIFCIILVFFVSEIVIDSYCFF